MGAVPRLIEPPAMPEGVRRIIETIGNSARAELLHNLAAGPATATDLATTLGVGRGTVHAHLGALEDVGLVTGDIPEGARHGRTVHWHLNRSAVDAYLDELRHYLTSR